MRLLLSPFIHLGGAVVSPEKRLVDNATVILYWREYNK
jgi:hypothetical protein